LLCAISGALLALLIGWAQTPIYRAQASLEVQGFSGNFSNAREQVPPTHENVSDSYIQTQLKILRSETLLQRLAEKLRLADRSEFRGSPKGRQGSVARGPLPVSVHEQVRKKLARNMAIRVSGQANVIEVLYESPDPQLATDIVNTFVGEFIAYSVERRMQAAKRTGESLEKQVSELKAVLERSENELQDYAAVAGLLLTANNDTVAELRLRQLQDTLS